MKVRLQSVLAVSAAIAAAALASATVVRADGMDRGPGPAGYAPTNWSGIYIGAQTGWMDSTIKGNFAPLNTPFSFEADPQTGIAGIHLGYQHQWGNFVLGVEGSLSGDFLTDEKEGSKVGGGLGGACGFVANTETCNGRITSIRDIGGKAGWAMGQWMAYGTGGFAEARINTWGTVLPGGTRFSEGSNTHDGWFAGGGLDYALSKHAIIGLQYKHYSFDSEAHAVPVATDSRVVHADSDAIMSRLTFKFGLDRGYDPLK
jgi:outer membrane immunogenic protein